MSWQDDEISDKQIALIKRLRFKAFGVLGHGCGLEYDDYRRMVKTKGQAGKIIDWLKEVVEEPELPTIDERMAHKIYKSREFDILIGNIPKDQAEYYLAHGHIKRK